MTEEARHTVNLTDRQVTLIERALLAYSQVIRIQTAAASKTEMDEAASVTATVQQHLHCHCTPRQKVIESTRRTPIPLDQRRTV